MTTGKGLRRLRYAPVELLAAIFFFIPSFGYVTYDIAFGFVFVYCQSPSCVAWKEAESTDFASIVLTTVWATAYLVDAFLYAISLWIQNVDNRNRFVFWGAELGNIVASILYLASQALYFHPLYSVELLNPYWHITHVQAILYFVSLALWAVNGVHYFAAYWTWRQENLSEAGPLLKDVWFWAEVWNMVASVGYAYISLWALLLMYPAYYASLGVTQEASYTAFDTWYGGNQAFQLVLNFVFDIMFSVSAALYGVLWWKTGSSEMMVVKDEAGYYELPEK